jgi:hypothetical protein
MINFEKIIKESIKASVSRSQQGDVSQFLLEQDFFEKEIPEGLKTREKFDKGNPIDTLEIFKRQN